MMTLVTGGAASGKSEFAEALILKTRGSRVYLATMAAFGPEDRARIARHRALRTGKGFSTEEIPRNVACAQVGAGDAVLLECVSNLLANEMFASGGDPERIVPDILSLRERCAELVVVTGEVFSDGTSYDAQTEKYLLTLARINRALAQAADRVYEVVVGIPILRKGEDA